MDYLRLKKAQNCRRDRDLIGIVFVIREATSSSNVNDYFELSTLQTPNQFPSSPKSLFKMSFLRPCCARSILLRSSPRPFVPITLRARLASGYGDPSENPYPTPDAKDQKSSTQASQAEHPGPKENEPSSQGGSSFGDKGQDTKAKTAPTDTKSSSRAAETSWDGNKSAGKTGSRVHGKNESSTSLGGNLSGNRDKSTDSDSKAGTVRGKGDVSEIGKTDGEDARDVGGKDDTRKQS